LEHCIVDIHPNNDFKLSHEVISVSSFAAEGYMAKPVGISVEVEMPSEHDRLTV
jgi:hypothetical protein